MENPHYLPPSVRQESTSTLAIISLIAGIMGWVGFVGIGPIVAVITGHMAKREIDRSQGMLTGGSLATAGLVLGYVNLALSIIGLCLVVVFFLLSLSAPLLCFPFMNQIQ
jgi:hypothetical protein